MAKKQAAIQLEVIAYLSTQGTATNIREKENKQKKALEDYAKANSLKITRFERRLGFSAQYVRKDMQNIIREIENGQAEGLLIYSTRLLPFSMPQIYSIVGCIKEAKGHLVSLEEGDLFLPLKGGLKHGK